MRNGGRGTGGWRQCGPRRLAYQCQLVVPISYRGVPVGQHRLDLLVEGEVVVELKAVEELTRAHFAVVGSYLRAIDRRHGLRINFAPPTLDVRRVLARAPLRVRTR